MFALLTGTVVPVQSAGLKRATPASMSREFGIHQRVLEPGALKLKAYRCPLSCQVSVLFLITLSTAASSFVANCSTV